MSELSKDVVALLQYLVPGFLVAWVYFGLTSHIKPSQFERVVQALIFTVVVQVVVAGERWGLELLGTRIPLGPWTEQSTLVSSLVTALTLGVAISACVNNDWVHRVSRKLNITSRTGHPCEWFGIFTDYQRFIVLQLKDGTRIYGWPKVWPSEADRGHFFVTSAVRVVDGIEEDLVWLDGILINATDVSSVEFVKKPEAKNEQPQATSATHTLAAPGPEGTRQREPAADLRAATDTSVSA